MAIFPRTQLLYPRKTLTVKKSWHNFSGRCKICLRPCFLPPFWIKITSAYGLANFVQRRDIQLVLNSRNIPFIISHFKGQEYIYVPPTLEIMAKKEIRAYKKENAPVHVNMPHYPIYKDCALAALFLAPLVFCHILDKVWIPSLSFLPNLASLNEIGKLDAIKLRFFGEWWRTGTALTLHASISHLVSNLAFGALFLALLARIAGIGRAFFLTVLGGLAGNALSVAFHPLNYNSIGFSTALFACIGILSALTLYRAANRKKRFMAMAAGIALLAMLGTEGEHTDYGAHIAGLLAGCALGFYEGWRTKRNWPGLSQNLAGVIGVAVLLLCWASAVWHKMQVLSMLR